MDICTHTNTYAHTHIVGGSHHTYTGPGASWQDTTPEEMYRLIGLLIYFGLVRVTSNNEKYWSIKTLYHGLWARSMMSRTRFKALMALFHIVDPNTETPGNKVRKVQSFLMDFKSRYLSFYQPSQNFAIDERLVKSRHCSGIRQYIKDKPTKWGIMLYSPLMSFYQPRLFVIF